MLCVVNFECSVNKTFNNSLYEKEVKLEKLISRYENVNFFLDGCSYLGECQEIVINHCLSIVNLMLCFWLI